MHWHFWLFCDPFSFTIMELQNENFCGYGAEYQPCINRNFCNVTLSQGLCPTATVALEIRAPDLTIVHWKARSETWQERNYPAKFCCCLPGLTTLHCDAGLSNLVLQKPFGAPNKITWTILLLCISFQWGFYWMRREWFVLHDTGRCLKLHALLLSGLKVTDGVCCLHKATRFEISSLMKEADGICPLQ